MTEKQSSEPQAPESLEKGLLQILWTAKPWIRNVVLIVVGAIVFFVALVPQDLREDLIRRLFHAPNRPASIARPDLNDENSHVVRLKNGHVVRLAGGMVKNRSNVSDTIIGEAVEADAWRYLTYCYDGTYGALKTLPPAGAVTVEFDVLDQLPQHAKVGASDFASSAFGDCIVRILTGQTINAAGPSGNGHVAYSFKFVPD